MSLHQFSKRKQGEFFYSHTEPIRFSFRHNYKKGKNEEANWWSENVELKGWCNRGRHCTMIGAHLTYRWYWAKSEETPNETVHNIHQHLLRGENSRYVVPSSR